MHITPRFISTATVECKISMSGRVYVFFMGDTLDGLRERQRRGEFDYRSVKRLIAVIPSVRDAAAVIPK